MAREETEKEVSSLEDAGYHLLMKEVDTSSCSSAIEWILDAKFITTEIRHPDFNLVICSPG